MVKIRISVHLGFSNLKAFVKRRPTKSIIIKLEVVLHIISQYNLTHCQYFQTFCTVHVYYKGNIKAAINPKER